LKRIMKSAPVLVLSMVWSRKFLRVCAGKASAEPDTALETGQLRGMVGAEVVAEVVELEVELMLLVVVLVVVIVTAATAWISGTFSRRLRVLTTYAR